MERFLETEQLQGVVQQSWKNIWAEKIAAEAIIEKSNNWKQS